MTARRARRQSAVEATAAGLAFGSGLCWVSTGMVASFRPGNLADPYWTYLPDLRTDTCGIAAFAVLAVSLTASEYLRRSRGRPLGADEHIDRRSVIAALSVAWTVAVLGTAIVVYISVNAVTHPATLDIAATHVLSWPTEGTLRVAALVLVSCAAAVLRLARASGSRLMPEATHSERHDSSIRRRNGDDDKHDCHEAVSSSGTSRPHQARRVR